MTKEKVKTTLDKNKIQRLASEYKDKTYGFFNRGKIHTQIILTVIFTALTYGIVWCFNKFANWMEWWRYVWYVPVIFALITLVICLIITIHSTMAKNKILKQIPKEDKSYFFSLVGIEYKKEDEYREERFLKSIQSSKIVRPSEYNIERANEKEKQAMKKDLEETLDKLNDAIKQSRNESYDVYDNSGNYIGRADKK